MNIWTFFGKNIFNPLRRFYFIDLICTSTYKEIVNQIDLWKVWCKKVRSNYFNFHKSILKHVKRSARRDLNFTEASTNVWPDVMNFFILFYILLHKNFQNQGLKWSFWIRFLKNILFHKNFQNHIFRPYFRQNFLEKCVKHTSADF